MSEAIRYYFDEHIDPAIAVGLRRCGIDVLTAREAGRLGHDDLMLSLADDVDEQGAHRLVVVDHEDVELLGHPPPRA